MRAASSQFLPGHRNIAELVQRSGSSSKRGISAYSSSVLKIQLLGNTESEFTSIKQKLSISHSAIIKY